MMRSVLISIKPKWCELIASGKKTIEVRKTKPKLETPFKVYIYCTKQKVNGEILLTYDKKVKGRNKGFRGDADVPLAGKVIGEFVCDSIEEIGFSPYNHGEYVCKDQSFIEQSCVPFDEMFGYLRDNYGYGWHISNLLIYDEPKPLNMFYKECAGLNNTGMCYECENAVGEECDCAVNGQLHLTHPPQSWCYVERCK